MHSLTPLDTANIDSGAQTHPQPAGVAESDTGTTSKRPSTHDRSLDSGGHCARGVLVYFGLATFRKAHYWLF